MQNYFDREITQLQKELLRLKTSQQKFAGQVPTISKSINFNIPLRISTSGFSAIGQKNFRIVVNNNAFFTSTLSTYYDDVTKHATVPLETRYMTIQNTFMGGSYYVRVFAHGTESGANSDLATLRNGGSVSLTNKLTIICTDDFTIEEE